MALSFIRAVLFALAMQAILGNSVARGLDHVKSWERLSPESQRLVACASSDTFLGASAADSDSWLCGTIRTHGREFNIALERFTPLHHKAVLLGGAERRHFNLAEEYAWLHGSVVGESHSFVRLTVRRDASDDSPATYRILQGSIQTSSNGTFVFESRDHVHSVVYHSSQIQEEEIGGHCSVHLVSDPSVGINDTREDHPRSRRGPVQGPDSIVCDMFLDADKSFYEAWGGEGDEDMRVKRTMVKMIDSLFQVDGLLTLPQNLHTMLALRIVGCQVHSTLALAPTTQTTNNGGILLDRYKGWLYSPGRGSGVLASTEVCLNHLFTHSQLYGTLGVAVQASSSSLIGGMCESRLFQSLALNAAFTNTLSTAGKFVPQWQTILATSHEIGHNLGAVHDCEISTPPAICSSYVGVDPCVPSESMGGGYLMYPAVALDNTHVNAPFFSPCSLGQIQAVISAKGSCLQKASPCMSKTGECCLGNNLLLNVVCRSASSADSCQADSLCDGVNPTCPLSANKTDGTTCRNPAGIGGVCYHGVCEHPNDQFCFARGLGPQKGCSIPDHECVRACLNGSACLPYEKACVVQNSISSQSWFSASSNFCPSLALDSVCPLKDGNLGLCAQNGSCTACSTTLCVNETSSSVKGSGASWTYTPTYMGPCSQPCGGGVRALIYSCTHTNGSVDSTGDMCAFVQDPPTETGPCGLQACSSSLQNAIKLEFDIPLTNYSDSKIIVTLSHIISIPLSVAYTFDQAYPAAINVISCRITVSEGCLDAGSLLALLSNESTEQAFRQLTSYSYKSSEYENKSISSSPSITFGIIIGVMGLAILFTVLVCVILAKRLKEKRDLAKAYRARKAKRHQIPTTPNHLYAPPTHLSAAPPFDPDTNQNNNSSNSNKSNHHKNHNNKEQKIHSLSNQRYHHDDSNQYNSFAPHHAPIGLASVRRDSFSAHPPPLYDPHREDIDAVNDVASQRPLSLISNSSSSNMSSLYAGPSYPNDVTQVREKKSGSKWQSSTIRNPVSTIPAPSHSPVLHQALSGYSGKTEYELSFEEGDFIIILDKSDTEPGWWKGQIGRHVGFFPSECVSEFPLD